MVKISTNLFSGVGMSLGLGLLDSDINRGCRDTVFFKRYGTTVQKWGHFGFAVGGDGLAGQVGRSDIGSVSQPLESTKACFK